MRFHRSLLHSNLKFLAPWQEKHSHFHAHHETAIRARLVVIADPSKYICTLQFVDLVQTMVIMCHVVWSNGCLSCKGNIRALSSDQKLRVDPLLLKNNLL